MDLKDYQTQPKTSIKILELEGARDAPLKIGHFILFIKEM